MGSLRDKLKAKYGRQDSWIFYPPAPPADEISVDPPRPTAVPPKTTSKNPTVVPPKTTPKRPPSEKICRICGAPLTGRKRVLCDACRVVAAKRHQDRKHARTREVSRMARVSTPCVICGIRIPVEDKIKSNIVTCSAECKRLNRNRQKATNRRRKKEEIRGQSTE